MKQIFKKFRANGVKYPALFLALLLLLVMPLVGCAPAEAPTEAPTEVTYPFDVPDFDPADCADLWNPMKGPAEDPYGPRETFYERRAEIDPQFFIDAIDYWEEVALYGEFEANHDGRVKKWKDPLFVFVRGEPGDADLATVERMITQINSLGVVPEITLQEKEDGETNVTIYFEKLSTILEKVDGAREDNWGMFFFRWHNDPERVYEMRKSFIYVATDVTDQKARNHLIQEEFIQQLGLINDSFDYDDSIFQQKWTTCQYPNEMDWLLIEMLYRPEIEAAMAGDEALQILADLYLDYLE